MTPLRELRPFGAKAFPFRLEASGRIQNRLFKVKFCLSGNVSNVSLPAAAASPARLDGLWERTCFEVFLNPAGTDAYWEFNFAPSGDWAVYRFEGYRVGMRPEEGVTAVESKASAFDPGKWTFTVDLSRVTEFNSVKEFHCGYTAVIESKSGDKTYWAVSHPKEVPNFHAKEGFTATLNVF